MWKNLFISFSLAQENIRSRLLHTLLSILGVVIGVAALVAILSLIDGMEQYAQEMITKTTSLKAVFIRTQTHKMVNQVRIKKESYPYLDYSNFRQLTSALTLPAKTYLQIQQSNELTLKETRQTFGAFIMGTTAPTAADTLMAYGKCFTPAEVVNQRPVAFVNHSFAKQVMGKDSLHALLGKHISFHNKELVIIGILAAEESVSRPATVFVPISLFTPEELQVEPPVCIIEAGQVEHVPVLKAQVEKWLKEQFREQASDFTLSTNEMRVKQATQGFLLFRVVMGLIVGISVVVGGIGIMNVLLISVTERTVEIGIRKAMGAKKRDILLQFLAESITISSLGSFLGLVLGILSTMVIIPLIKASTQIPFQAAYTTNTFLLISFIAVVIGIVFGTYPALRAARLDPVEAIRREG